MLAERVVCAATENTRDPAHLSLRFHTHAIITTDSHHTTRDRRRRRDPGHATEHGRNRPASFVHTPQAQAAEYEPGQKPN